MLWLPYDAILLNYGYDVAWKRWRLLIVAACIPFKQFLGNENDIL